MSISRLKVETVAVGTENPVKIAAVTEAIVQVWPSATCQGCRVESGVSEQPMSEDEAILGATNRATLACQRLSADLGVGLEGYTVDTAHGMFLSAWIAIVRDDELVQGSLQIGLGSGGRLLVPELLAESVRQGEELGPLMDLVVGQVNTKQKQGAVGILTNGLVDRRDALRLGVLYALARFVWPLPYTK